MLSSQKQLFEKYAKHSAKTTPLKKDFYFDFIKKKKKKGKKQNCTKTSIKEQIR